MFAPPCHNGFEESAHFTKNADVVANGTTLDVVSSPRGEPLSRRRTECATSKSDVRSVAICLRPSSQSQPE